MKNYRVGFTKNGRCHAEYVEAIGPCAADIAVEKMHHGSTSLVAREIKTGIKTDKEWADSETH